MNPRVKTLAIVLAIAGIAIFATALRERSSGREPSPAAHLPPHASSDRVGEVIAFTPPRERPPEFGKFRMRERNGRLSISANQAWRFEILEALADRGNFEIIDHVRRHPLVSLEAQAETFEQVIARLMHDAPYAIRYVVGDEDGAASIDSLELGLAQTPEPDDEKSARDEREGEPRDDWQQGDEPSGKERKASDLAKRGREEPKRVEPRPEAERRLAMERREEREAIRHERYLEQLSDPDPEVRAWATAALDVKASGDLISLGELLDSDPNESVRAEVARGLGFGNPDTAVPMLVEALDDSSPQVVAVAASSLGFLDEPSAIDPLQDLLRNDSQTIRQAAREALELLER
ncbi:MAG: HEAT repeat domain-containing protein [bacterium]|nr:HEAT repeat domain-containing protein [bacterium]